MFGILLDKHGARLDIVDVDGISPQEMAVMNGAAMSSVAELVKNRAIRGARAIYKAAKRQCSQCAKVETADEPLRLCSNCKTAQYCSKECQTKHWREAGHKEACKKAAEERSKTVVLEQPKRTSPYKYSRTISFSNPSLTLPSDDSYQKPDYVAVGELFHIKVQCSNSGMPMLIYDKSRQCQFYYGHGQRGYAEMYEKVREEKMFDGKKTDLAASFDKFGNCTVYLGTSKLKKW